MTLVTFIIPVRHQANASDWNALKARLSQTVASIAGQSNADWRGVIVANEGADLPDLPPQFFGEGITEDLFPGASKPDYANTSWRDYGNRVGGFRLIDAFAARGIPLSILLNTAVYDHAPDLTDHARAAGCEIVGHGLTNSDTLAGRSPQDERAYLKAVADRIAEKEGAPPKGWSSPWLAHTDRTPEEWRNKVWSNLAMVLCTLAFAALAFNEARKAILAV